jgi:prevent-host-death family protein
MERVVSATQARINLGELMRWAVEKQEPVVVAHGGKPHVVLLPLELYEHMKATASQQPDWRERVRRSRQQIRSELGERPLPPPDQILREIREERDEQLLDLR